MFEVYPWFQWFLVQHTRPDGSTWYVSRIHKDGSYSWTRDPLCARHFSLRIAKKYLFNLACDAAAEMAWKKFNVEV